MLAPVERRCICVSDQAVGHNGHTPDCNARHSATFFATVATAREDLKRKDRPHG